jgi:hypothetical protein
MSQLKLNKVDEIAEILDLSIRKNLELPDGWKIIDTSTRHVQVLIDYENYCW